MFVVCRLEKFDLEPSSNQIFRVPFQIKVETNMIGFLPVYLTREEALKDYPESELIEIKLKEEETHVTETA